MFRGFETSKSGVGPGSLAYAALFDFQEKKGNIMAIGAP